MRMKHIVSFLLVLALLLPAVAFAQNRESKVTVIRAGKLVDVRNGRVLADQIIIIEGERIR